MLRSHKTHVALLHFNQVAWILWLTSLLISPSFWIIEPKYLKWLLIAVFLVYLVLRYYNLGFPVLLNLYSIYSVLTLLNLKPRDSKFFLYISNSAFTPTLILSTRIISSANNIHHGISSWIVLISPFITMANKNGLNADPWCNPIVIEKSEKSSDFKTI